MNLKFIQLITPTSEIAKVFTLWANDPELIGLLLPNRNHAELELQTKVSQESLNQRLQHQGIYLIYDQEKLVGEMTVQIDSGLLHNKEPGSAWIGIAIGDAVRRNKGMGTKALEFLEKKIMSQGHHRIELGVFGHNIPAQNFYKKNGYKEITRFKNFTYWQGKMWPDIRMEKHLEKIKSA